MSLLHRRPFLGQLEVIQSEEECAICYESTTYSRKTACNHLFCLECSTKWCAVDNTCPNCRIILYKESSEDPVLVHLVRQFHDGREDEHIIVERRDIEAENEVDGGILAPASWLFARNRADWYEDPEENEIQETDGTEAESTAQVEVNDTDEEPQQDDFALGDSAIVEVAVITENMSELGV
ncbi:hypothetical protein DOTSEDRAFT_28305 [Dothistroma septosporum NZE10]|uniref:RING-type domain-containing protein n=1 Tax=Dothistroma septosporum (strain NZE10 / CBS 128990) TaxID=675120 RepID=M2Y1D6_DOTSN|nr:hypothetical protein DOTSEDRAFT_28305 [Dothistroma septosporum NZE10]